MSLGKQPIPSGILYSVCHQLQGMKLDFDMFHLGQDPGMSICVTTNTYPHGWLVGWLVGCSPDLRGTRAKLYYCSWVDLVLDAGCKEMVLALGLTAFPLFLHRPGARIASMFFSGSVEGENQFLGNLFNFCDSVLVKEHFTGYRIWCTV